MAKRGEHLHVLIRGAERYGLTLTADDVRSLGRAIRDGHGTDFAPPEKKHRREGRRGARKVFVCFGAIELPVVYHEGRGHILTILPPEAAEVQRAIAKRSPAVEQKADGR